MEGFNTNGKFKNLIFCVSGVVGSYLFFHFLYEKLITENPVASEIGIIFYSNVVYSSIAWCILYIKSKKTVRIPWTHGFRIALCLVGAGWCTTRALRYINVPTQTIAKSCKPLPTMILGKAMGKRYNLLQYMCTLVICVGITIFNMSSISGTPLIMGNRIQGLLLIGFALFLDGATGAFEDVLVQKMNWKHGEGTFYLMFYLHLFSIPLSFSFSMATEGMNGMIFVYNHFWETTMLTLVGAIGQIFIFHTIATNGALTCCVITTCRKMFTVILSVTIFGHMITSTQIFGVVLTFAGLGLDIHQKLMGFSDLTKDVPATFKRDSKNRTLVSTV